MLVVSSFTGTPEDWFNIQDEDSDMEDIIKLYKLDAGAHDKDYISWSNVSYYLGDFQWLLQTWTT